MRVRVIRSGGVHPLGQILTGEEAREALRQGFAIPIPEVREIETR